MVAGLGSPDRRDDGAGPLVAARAAGALEKAVDIGPLADPLDLLGLWDGADLAVVIDAVRTGAPPGSLRWLELDAGGEASAAGAGATGTTAGMSGPVTEGHLASTHGIGLGGVLRLARALGRGPKRVVVLGIEGADFRRGEQRTPAVEAALPVAVEQVLELVKEVTECA